MVKREMSNDWLEALNPKTTKEIEVVAETQPKNVKTEEKRVIRHGHTSEIAFEKMEDSEKKRYTFNLSLRAREQLSELTKYYQRRSDSAMLEEIVAKLYDQMKR
ncbi:hypothetical protein [Enterococcus cecorum]|uniref:hypothetical protein n=1 Tax=Enterococcus cecorum TaxID=44008 RepID=UPI00148B8BFB|nr:hypothetical protein [Enterococcus cecorum]